MAITENMPGATRVILVRHGESVSNHQSVISGWSDTPLTDRGRRQAAWTARALAESVAVVALYASPLSRAWETATIVGASLGLVPVAVDDLREINAGLAEGRPFPEVVAEYPELQRKIDRGTLDFQWPGGESLHQIRARVTRAIRTIVMSHPEETVIAVAHAGSLGWALAELLIDNRPGYPDWPHQNCAISEVLVPPDFPHSPGHLVRHNDCAHLLD